MNKHQLALNDVAYRLHLRENLKEEHYQGDASLVKLQDLVDKATPKKPIVEVKEIKYKKITIHEHIPHCPICNTRLFRIGVCCHNNECRQALDWSNNE